MQINNIPFNGYSITKKEFEFLDNLIKKNNLEKILEFGTGTSTICFLNNNCFTTSFETSQNYIKKFFFRLTQIKNCNIIYYKINQLNDIILNQFFDLAFIDGPNGTKTMSRIDSCLFSIKYTNHLLLHDFRRVGEQESLKYIINNFPKWKLLTIKTDRCLGYLYNSDKVVPLKMD